MGFIRKIVGMILLLFSAFFAVGLLGAVALIFNGEALFGTVELIISFVLTSGFYSLAKKIYPSSLKIF